MRQTEEWLEGPEAHKLVLAKFVETVLEMASVQGITAIELIQALQQFDKPESDEPERR